MLQCTALHCADFVAAKLAQLNTAPVAWRPPRHGLVLSAGLSYCLNMARCRAVGRLSLRSGNHAMGSREYLLPLLHDRRMNA
jgi:hypothetical protein